MDIVKLTSKLITIAKPSCDINWELDWLEDIFASLWWKIFKIETKALNSDNIIPHYLLEIWDGEKRIWFVSHYDVVPYWTGWDYPVNEWYSDGKYLYWRWSCDMLSWLATELLIWNEFKDKFTFSIYLAWDEEADAKWVRELLKAFPRDLDYIIWSEPTSNITAWDAIKIWRRWRVLWKIKFHWDAMHAAYVWTAKWTNITKFLISGKLDSIFLWFWEDLEFMPKTTCAITWAKTDFISENTVPSELEIMFDARINSDWTPDTFLSELKNRLYKEWIRYDIEVLDMIDSYLTLDDEFIKIAWNSIQEVTWVYPSVNCTWWTSDCRFFKDLECPIIEIWVENWTIHKQNEKVSLESLNTLMEIYRNFLESLYLTK